MGVWHLADCLGIHSYQYWLFCRAGQLLALDHEGPAQAPGKGVREARARLPSQVAALGSSVGNDRSLWLYLDVHGTARVVLDRAHDLLILDCTANYAIYMSTVDYVIAGE